MNPTQSDLCQSRLEDISHYLDTTGWLVRVQMHRDDFLCDEYARREPPSLRVQSSAHDTATAEMHHT